jgi:hypothetical protein
MADSKKDTASADFKKAQRAEDGKRAMLEYEAEAIAVRAKTERLRALRLARDAALPPPAPKTASASKKKTAKPKGAAAGKLADWLDGQEKSGRKS